MVSESASPEHKRNQNRSRRSGHIRSSNGWLEPFVVSVWTERFSGRRRSWKRSWQLSEAIYAFTSWREIIVPVGRFRESAESETDVAGETNGKAIHWRQHAISPLPAIILYRIFITRLV